MDNLSEAEKTICEAEQEADEEWKEFSVLQVYDKEKLRQIIKVIRVYSQNEIEIEWKCDDGFRKVLYQYG